VVNFQAVDQYVHAVVANMVDNVCLYEARIDEIKQRYKEEESTTPSSPSDKDAASESNNNSPVDKQ